MIGCGHAIEDAVGRGRGEKRAGSFHAAIAGVRERDEAVTRLMR